ncbi:extracellular solute-binding protein [Kaistia geumhonensis]|uniref:Multiple sugar transport system substrate-binding protein n=1 Tax=Kaistia geumhonensis TaxID=410839 RepID=A0ABU0M6Y5_9HYPH|nr:extracellular solute-binding protein [Kaistia geumhonensis]MCX5478056.1 extracellular solute-binding protein [Kaistia geumhonensis]MDQ0516728.1 multiple sugar transport system substrate-binding protein [Kaistia geumhonensis]
MAKDIIEAHRRPGPSRRQVLQGGAALGAAAAMGGLAPQALAQEKIKLTIWAWTPKTQELANLYSRKNPNVEVVVENVGQGAPHYVKLRNAITAGTGLPDLGQIEFNSIPSFRALNALADIGKDGANAVKGEFVDWTWSAVSNGDAVYGLPWDSGPMATLYRADVYEKHGLKPAETWDEFSEQAMKLAKDAPGTYLTDFANDSGWTAAVLWQAGWRPFKTDGSKIQIRINDDVAKKWANYWQKLIDAKAVDTKPGWTSEWFAAFDDGTYAAWVTAGWAPVLMQQAMKKSFGKWRAAPMPQWEKGGKVTSNWGGSTFAAFTTTPHPKEAADLAVFLTTDPEVSRKWNTEAYLFPVLKSLLSDKDLMGHKYDFYGGQAVNEIFAASEAEVDPSFEFSPFQDYVNSQIEDNFAAAVSGKGTLAEAFDRIQDTVVTYAQDQGFEVT